MDFLNKLRKQPENVRKVILWLVVIILGIILAFFWIRNVSKKIEKLENQNFIEQVDLSDFKKELENMPKIEIPGPTDEELEALEKEIYKLEENNKN